MLTNDGMFGEVQLMPASGPIPWTRRDDKEFELFLVKVPEGQPDRWQIIAGHLGRSPAEVEERYKMLVHDVLEIESGRFEPPNYINDLWESRVSLDSKKHSGEGERKKGRPWTKHEHKLFLIGLERFGKGDWRSISRNVVVTRNATQVASHAQKYFLRQNQVKKERKRSSIHDITSVDGTEQNWDPPPDGSATRVATSSPSEPHAC